MLFLLFFKSLLLHIQHATQHLLTLFICVQFVSTMEANILATLSVVANVTINNVTPGSIKVDNSVAFTGADAAAAATAQRQFALLVDPKNADSLSSIYGTSFGTVTVSGVTLTNSTNPSKCFPTVILSPVEALVLGSFNHWVYCLMESLWHQNVRTMHKPVLQGAPDT